MESETCLSHKVTNSEEHKFLPNDTDAEDKEDKRGRWSHQVEFILSLVGYCVGPGNLWRFPYLCNRNGGGAFLIPYFIFLILIAVPIFSIEVAMGQFSGRGALHVWSICPLFKGIGFTMTMVSSVTSMYFNLIIAWVLYYLVRSFAAVLPWSVCGNSWNTPTCFVPQYTGDSNVTDVTNVTWVTNVTGVTNVTDVTEVTGITDVTSSLQVVLSNTSSVYNVFDDVIADNATNFTGTGNQSRTMSSVEEFWQFNTLNISEGIEDFGSLQLHMALCMLGAWFLIFLCLIKGVKSVGKVVYVTATLPYILLVIFVVRTLMLPGAKQGVIFYLTPDFNRLIDFQVWVEALLQIFYTVGMCWGGLVTMASYNKFNNNCIRDSVFITLLGEGTSFFAGFAVFSVLGFMAEQMDVPISEVVQAGPGLAFIAYPEALGHLPIPQLWAVLFFVMLLTIGLDSVFGMVETLVTSLIDSFPDVLLQKRMITTAVICMISFLVGLPLSFQSGVYIFQLLDWYVAVFNMLMVGFLECIIIGWIYGADRFTQDIEMMLGKKPRLVSYMKILWRFISPALLVFGMVLTVVNYKPPTYGDYHYPGYAEIIGWGFALTPLLPVIVCMFIEISKAKGTLWQRIKAASSPDDNWFPKCKTASPQTQETSQINECCVFYGC